MGDQHARGRVRRGLHQDGNAEIRPAQGVGDGALVAEVRQRNHDAVDFFSMFFEEVSAFSGVLERLHRAVFRIALFQRDRLDAFGIECGDHIATALAGEMTGEKSPVSNNDAECHRFV